MWVHDVSWVKAAMSLTPEYLRAQANDLDYKDWGGWVGGWMDGQGTAKTVMGEWVGGWVGITKLGLVSAGRPLPALNLCAGAPTHTSTAARPAPAMLQRSRWAAASGRSSCVLVPLCMLFIVRPAPAMLQRFRWEAASVR